MYQQIAAATLSTIAPAAQAWQAVGRADSTLDLYDADGIHANAVGSYLTACVLLAAITERSPHGVAPSSVAGILVGLVEGDDLRRAVRRGVAASAAAVMTPGTELCRREDAERLYRLLLAEMPGF